MYTSIVSEDKVVSKDEYNVHKYIRLAGCLLRYNEYYALVVDVNLTINVPCKHISTNDLSSKK